MKKLLVMIMVFCSLSATAQFSKAAMDSLNKFTRADYQQMLDQLGIKPNENRPGPSGNPNDANAANRIEEKVNRYLLPDPLVLKNGKKITTANEWWNKRRAEIVDDFDKEIYGRVPKNIPVVKWEIVSVKDTMIGNFKAREKIVKGVVDNSSYPNIDVQIDLQVVTPADANGNTGGIRVWLFSSIWQCGTC